MSRFERATSQTALFNPGAFDLFAFGPKEEGQNVRQSIPAVLGGILGDFVLQVLDLVLAGLL